MKGNDGMPDLSHLRESGSIEQDSDIVLMLNRKERASTDGVLRIAKNRQGQT